MRISLTELSQLVLKYAYTLDILIHQFVHKKYLNDTLLIFLNFWKTIWSQKTWMKLNQVHWKKLFFKSLEKLTKCCQKIPCGQTDESKHLVHRHILKPVAKVHEEKLSFLCFFSLPAIRHADSPWYRYFRQLREELKCLFKSYFVGFS